MRPLFFVLLLCHCLVAWADPPKFSEGGAIFGIQFGPGIWALDEPGLTAQVGPQCPQCAHVYVTQAQNAPTLGVRLGYNILGHASIELNIVGTGWNVFNTARGGAGFATGNIAWHPLELIFINKPQRPIPLDASMMFGVGYGIGGQQFGMDGLILQWGMNASWWFNRFFGLGAFVRGTFMMWKNFYLDYDNRVSIPLPNGSGGAFWSPGIEVLFRFGE